MFQRLLVPLDGSPGAERAIPVAASLARKAHGSLVFLHMVSPATALKSTLALSAVQKGVQASDKDVRQAEAIEQTMAEAANYLALLPPRYENELAGLPIEMHIAFGTAAPTLPSTARLEHVDLIVLCRHQEVGIGQWGLESITQQVMRHSPVPLLILNEHEQTLPVLDGTRPARILVPLDGSLFAETVLKPALQLLTQCTGSAQHELCLLHVVDLFAGNGTDEVEAHPNPYTTDQARQGALLYLQMIAAHLHKLLEGRSNLRITCRVTRGVDIASAILNQSTQGQEPVTLIALATHGREGISRQTMGSIAEHLLNATTTPLLTICPRTTTVRLLNFALPSGGE